MAATAETAELIFSRALESLQQDGPYKGLATFTADCIKFGIVDEKDVLFLPMVQIMKESRDLTAEKLVQFMAGFYFMPSGIRKFADRPAEALSLPSLPR